MSALVSSLLSSAFGNTHPAPDYQLCVEGKTINALIEPRLVELTLTDNRGFEADTLEIALDDSDGQLALPTRGATVSVRLGWAGKPLVDKGCYTVDEVEHSGTPDKLVIRAKSADLRAGLAVKREKSWAGHTIGEIVKTVAASHGLKPRVAKKLSAIKIGHVDQTSESDINLLTRLARDHDAIATVKSGLLLFMPIGECESATGQKFPTAQITRESGDQHRFAIAERDTYTGVRAYYQNVKGAKTGSVLVDKAGMSTGKKKAAPLAASADSVKVLRHTYANKGNAERAAKAEWQRLQRGVATFGLTLALARPDLFPELPATVKGFKREIDAETWLITRAEHRLSAGGFTTTLELELKPG